MNSYSYYLKNKEMLKKEKDFLLDTFKDENRKRKTDMDVETSFVSRKSELGYANLSEEFFEIYTFQRQNKIEEMIRKVGHLMHETGACVGPLMIPTDYACATKINMPDRNPPNLSLRSYCMAALKKRRQKRTKTDKHISSLMIQNNKNLFKKKLKNNISQQSLRATSASFLHRSMVTGKDCEVEPLLKKLNDISLKEFPDASQDVMDKECEMN